MGNLFKKATRHRLPARIAIDGPSGSGKTFTALRFAFALGKRVAVIDTEHRSASKYVGLAPDGVPWEFDVLELDQFDPPSYTEAILAAARAGYDVLVIDSLSHAWMGTGGSLDLVDKKTGDNKGNSFTAWREVTPMHNKMIDAIVRSPIHVLATMRTQTEYVMEENEKGKKAPRKIGLKPVQRAGVEYEFDIVCDIDQDHIISVSKTRCPSLDGKQAIKPGASFIEPAIEWLNDGTDVPEGYYCATEDDLRKLEKSHMASLSTTEKAKRAAEKAKAAKATTGDSAPDAQAKGNGRPKVGPLVSDDVADRIRGLLPQAYDDPEEFRSVLQSHGVSLIAELGQAEAATVLADVESRVSAKTSAATEPADPKSLAAKKDEPQHSTAAQRDEIKSLFAALDVDVDQQVEICRKRGVNSFRSFTVEQAEELLQKMRQALAEKNEIEGKKVGDDDIPF